MTIALTEHELQFALRHLDQLNPVQKAQVLSLLEERDKLARYEDARQHFLSFVKMVWPDFIPGAHHELIAEKFDQVAEGKLKRLIIDMPPRFCLAVDTPLLTPLGWTTMGAIEPGEYVYGPDGRPTKVLGKSVVHHDHRCFKVTTKDGAHLVADAGHLWSVGIERKRPHVFKLRTTEELYERQSRLSEPRRPWVPDNKAVQYPPQAKSLPVAPYLLGMWVGNGHADQAIITCDARDIAHVRALIEADGDETTDQANPLTFGVLRTKTRLRELGVLGKKHIPEAYMRASVQDRTRLLEGLFDSDGCAAKSGVLDISTSYPHLRDQYLELMRSLGINPHVYEHEARIGDKSYGLAWRLYFYATGFGRAPRKRSRTFGARKPVRRYVSVEPHETVPVQCIEVERPDGLFLAGRGLVVTHNTKSQFASWLLPAWFLGKFPKQKIIQVSNTETLAAGFGRQVRNMLDGEAVVTQDEESPDSAQSVVSPYREIFPKVRLAEDSKAAGMWHTNYGGEYFAVGVNGRVTGKGASIAIVDDAHSEQEAKQAETNPAIFDEVYNWYTSGIRQRLQPGGSIIIVATRWSKRDLVGRVLAQMDRDMKSGLPPDQYDKWDVLSLPAILDEGLPSERSMWPGFWPLAELQRTRNALPVSKWQAQYQQNPTSEGAAILKREYWRRWGDDDKEKCPGPQHVAAWQNGDPPACEYIIGSWDCAATANERSHPSAYTLWGVFKAEDPESGKTLNHIILLQAYKARMEFPELKRTAKQFYDEDRPDTLLIENKSAGMQLLQEFRSMGVPAESFTGSSRGSRAVSNDKIARANMIADVFASRYVWCPPTRFADEVMEQCASFPAGEEDDLVDSTVQAMMRFREGGFIRTANDEAEDAAPVRFRRKRYY